MLLLVSEQYIDSIMHGATIKKPTKLYFNILIILWNYDFNSSNLIIYVTEQDADVEIPDDDMENSEHVDV